jgi:hypothetical protein
MPATICTPITSLKSVLFHNLQRYLHRDESSEKIIIGMETKHRRTSKNLGIEDWDAKWQGLGSVDETCVERKQN